MLYLLCMTSLEFDDQIKKFDFSVRPHVQFCKFPREALSFLLSKTLEFQPFSKTYTCMFSSVTILLLHCTFHLVLQEGDKRQLRETSVHPPSSERYVHTFRDLSNFSGTSNITYRYLAGTPLNRKSKFCVFLSN